MAVKFILTTKKVVEWPVQVWVPQDGGKSAQQGFTARFEILPKSETDRLLKEDGERFDEALLEAALTGWGDDLVDEAKTPIPFSEEARRALIDIPYVRAALVEAYFKAARGGRAKN